MKQSRMMSLVEAVTNVAVGNALAVVTQIIVFPWFGLEAALGEQVSGDRVEQAHRRVQNTRRDLAPVRGPRG